jgi:hypothetical protein
MATNNWIMLGGLVAVAGVAYYLHSAGYFNSIFDALNKAIGKIKETEPLPKKEEEEKKKESKLALMNVGNSSGHRAYRIYRY